MIIHGLELWLSRSQHRLLSLRLYQKNDWSQNNNSADEKWWNRAASFGSDVLPFIIAHSQRWERVELNIPISMTHTLSDPNEGLANLTHLVLGSTQEDWGPGDDDPITLFSQAPRLRNLHLILETENNLNLGRLDRVALPFHQLTSLTGTLFGALECLVVLSKTPALVECDFHVGPTIPEGNFSPGTTLPCLKSLKLWSTARNVHHSAVLHHLTLPILETLVVGRGETRLVPALRSLVDRSHCNIRHFSCGSTVDREELLECLYTLPMLLTLELLDLSQTDAVELIRRLDFELDQTAGLVPHLESIALQCRRSHQDGDFSFAALHRLLDTMAARPLPLRNFRLTWTTSLLPREPDTQEVTAFKAIAGNGMTIYIGTEEMSWV
ncbi:hypothetical protein B0H15DRAFT_853480 [Mycena belliarum]|uniref:F-box domain-containing protein n=1 Tax=Mycena belliarum TaxID=1033014 RepID=A0AAD6TW52_9AGAR|nr:hypothetical protein B0H15DRAFT_853480 [Mycena belliae]